MRPSQQHRPTKSPEKKRREAESSSSSNNSSSSSRSNAYRFLTEAVPPEKDKEWFLGKIKYRNTLPEIPFEPKFLKYPFDPLRFVRYSATSLDKAKVQLRAEPHMGILIDLVDPKAYDPVESATLHSTDKELIAGPTSAAEDVNKAPERLLTWLRHPEYLSANASQMTPSRNVSAKPAAVQLISVAEQLEIIDRSFAVAEGIPEHPTKKNLQPVEVYSVFPNWSLKSNEYALCTFEMDPIDETSESNEYISPLQYWRGQADHAVLKPVEERDGSMHWSYLTPTIKTLADRKRGRKAREEEFHLVRDYDAVADAEKDDGKRTYFFVLREGEGMFYAECGSKLSLHKRLKKRHVFDVDDEGGSADEMEYDSTPNRRLESQDDADLVSERTSP